MDNTIIMLDNLLSFYIYLILLGMALFIILAVLLIIQALVFRLSKKRINLYKIIKRKTDKIFKKLFDL